MSIFNGHEDKSPEELANELGISDLSVIENAGKETIQTLENETLENNDKIDSLCISDDLWSNNFSFEDLQIGMSIKDIKSGKIFVINNIYNINSISIRRYGYFTFNVLKHMFMLNIYEKDWNDSSKRIHLEHIKGRYGGNFPDDLIGNNNYILHKHGNCFHDQIAIVNKDFQTTKNFNIDFPFRKEKWSYDDFISNCSIHKKDYAQHKIKEYTCKEIRLITSLDEIPVNTDIIDIREISVRHKVLNVTVDIVTKEIKIMTIGKIGFNPPFAYEDDDITLLYDSSFEGVSAKDVVNGSFYYLVDGPIVEKNSDKLETNTGVDDFLGLSNSEIEDDRLWQQFNLVNRDEIKIGTKVKKHGIGGILKGFAGNGNPIIKFGEFNGETEINSEDMIYIYKEDIDKTLANIIKKYQ